MNTNNLTADGFSSILNQIINKLMDTFINIDNSTVNMIPLNNILSNDEKEVFEIIL